MTISFVYILEMLGTTAFAISGALAASRKNMDIFGFSVLALLPAVGGGTIRDVIIDRTPVFWIADNGYIIVALLAAVLVFFTSYEPGSRQRILVWMDAMGLALFAVIGTQIGLQHDTGPLVAIMLGVMTAVTGGMIRDIVCNEIPLILKRGIYATAAFVAGLVYVAADAASMPSQVSLVIAVLAGFLTRALGIIFNLSLPAAGTNRDD